MPPIDPVPGIAPGTWDDHQGLTTREGSLLIAALTKALPATAQLKPQTIAQFLSDPVKLSMLVRQAGLQAALAAHDWETEPVLQTALAKVAPQHLQALLSMLEKKEQPAINLDEFYGEPASVQMRSSSGHEPGTTIQGYRLDEFRNQGDTDQQPDQPHFSADGAFAIPSREYFGREAVWLLVFGAALCLGLLIWWL